MRVEEKHELTSVKEKRIDESEGESIDESEGESIDGSEGKIR